MEITWYGLNCFRLTERGRASVVTDPYSPEAGPAFPRPRADIVTISYDDETCSYTRAVRGPFRVLNTPGEYEIGGVFITAIPTYADRKKGKKRGLNTVFLFDYNGLTVCHLGHLGHVPTQNQIEALGTVNILLVPVGDKGGLTPAEAAEVVSMLEPSIVIPMHFKVKGFDLPQGTLPPFLKQMGVEKIAPQESLKISTRALPDQTSVTVLTPRME